MVHVAALRNSQVHTLRDMHQGHLQAHQLVGENRLVRAIAYAVMLCSYVMSVHAHHYDSIEGLLYESKRDKSSVLTSGTFVAIHSPLTISKKS